MSAMASRMAGKAMRPSMTRITTMSRCRENPATRRMSAPATTLRLARVRRSHRGRVDGAADPTAGARTSTAASVIADPRINERVEQVDPEIDEHVDGGRDEDDPLHHGIVAPEDGRDDEAAQTRYVEHDLRDDSAADQ